MNKIMNIIVNKYYWVPEYRLYLLWASKAEYEGVEAIVTAEYLMDKILGFKNDSNEYKEIEI